MVIDNIMFFSARIDDIMLSSACRLKAIMIILSYDCRFIPLNIISYPLKCQYHI